MKSLINWLVVMFMGMFWILRIVVAYMDATGKDFMVKPINSTTEIVLLFVTFVCILLVIKRKWIGTIIYSVTYLLYFGADLVNILKPVIFDFQPFNSNNTMQVASSFFAIIIVIMLMCIVGLLLFIFVILSENCISSSFVMFNFSLT